MVFDGKSPIKWSVDQRMELIEFGLQTEERVNHNDLIRQCGTSKKQTALDLAQYLKQVPRNIKVTCQ